MAGKSWLFCATIALALAASVHLLLQQTEARILGLMIFAAPPLLDLPDGVPLLENQINFFKSFEVKPNYLEHIDFHPREPNSVPEAASRIYELGQQRNMPQVTRCSKYVKMLTEPLYRSRAAVEDLLEEERDFDEIEQPDANIQAKLPAEVNFNALKRMSIIHGALVNEGLGEVSTLDFKVQKELLDCMAYYFGRHERALAGMNEYIWNKKEQIPSYSGNLDVMSSKFGELMKQIEDLENSEDMEELAKEAAWMTKLAKLIRMLDEAHPIVPKSVVDFVAHDARAQKIEILARVLDDIDKMKRKCLDLEVQPDKLASYRDTLMQLYTLVKANKDWVVSEFDFILEPRRQAVIIGALYKSAREDDEGYELEPDEDEEAKRKPQKTVEELLGIHASRQLPAAA